MTLTKVAQRHLVADQAFDRIHAAIMSGVIPAGSRLRIRDLAHQLGTSPMPVRDSIARLEQAGLVRRVPHKGAVVTKLSPIELVSVYDMRLLLEREATRLGSQRLTPSEADEMRHHLRLMVAAVEAGNHAAAVNHDEALLMVLYTASRNSVLAEMIQTLWQRCRPYKLVGVEGAATHADPEIWSFQGPLISAASAHDTQAALAITERSLTSATDRIRALLASG